MTSRILAAAAGVLAVGLIAAQATPNDPYAHSQWNLRTIRAPEAWEVTRGASVVVAVVDSGVDLAHPDLAGAFARDARGRVLGRDFVDDDDDPTDEHGHGTMVAGIIAARTGNGTGVASVAPRASLMPVRVLDGDAAGTSSDVDAGIRWAVDNGADIVNLSLEVAREEGGGGISVLPPTASDSAIRYASDRGVTVVAAAGNDSDDFTDYPEDSPVLLVGATDRNDQRAGFSDTGRRDAVVAPGVDIVSTWCNPCGEDATHTVGQSEGTSYAAPQVAGTIALLRSIGYDADGAVERIRETAVDIGARGPDEETGHGRIDAAAAVGVTEPEPQPGAGSGTGEQPSERPGRTAAGRDPSQPDQGTGGGAPPQQPSTTTGGTAARPPVQTQPPPTLAPSPTDGPAIAPDTTTTSPPPQATRVPQRDPNRRWAVLAAVLLGGNLAVLGWALGRRRHEQ